MHRQVKRVRAGDGQAPAAPMPPAGLPPAERVLEIVTRAGLIFFEWSPTAGLTYLSDSAREALGYGGADLQKDPDLSMRLIHPDSRAALDAFGEELAENRPAK